MADFPLSPERAAALVDATIARIGPLDERAMAEARRREDELTKPAGSLGRLEEIAVQVAGITGRPRPRPAPATGVVMAADHGVAAEGVSAYPREVTAQMVANFLQGGAAINVLARQQGARVVVVDIGVAADLAPHPGLVARKIARGTRNLRNEPAMSEAEALAALAVGVEVAAEEVARGVGLLATGDMGIGNTTAASALTAVFTGRPPAEVTGRGTGIDDARLRRKVEVIEAALARHRPDPVRPLAALAAVGGLEIAGLVGLSLGGAAARVPVIVDGFIAGAAALVATALCPAVGDYLIAAHRSAEPGHRAQLDALGLVPLLDLRLRLGEGTGAALAIGIVEAALRTLDEMTTFAEGHVSRSTEREPER